MLKEEKDCECSQARQVSSQIGPNLIASYWSTAEYVLASGAEISLLMTSLSALRLVYMCLFEDVMSSYLSIESIGIAEVTLDSGFPVTFVVAKRLVHEAGLGIDILGDATLDLAHGFVVIPKLALDGQLERSGFGEVSCPRTD